MTNLGTLDFSVRLKNETATQAEEIKSNLLKNLQVGLDLSSLDSVVKTVKERLSNEIFEIKLSNDTSSTLSNIKNSLSEIKSNENIKLIDNESVQKTVSLVGQLREKALQLSWQILDQKDTVKQVAYETAKLGDAYREAKAAFGNRSSVTQAALGEYNAAKEALREESVTLFALQQNRARNNLSIKEQNLAYQQANDALKAARAELNKEKAARVEANKELERSKKLTIEAKTATESVKSSREDVKRQLEEERKKTDELTLAKQRLKNARLEEQSAASSHAASHIRLNGELVKGVRVSADLKEAFTSLYSVHMLREFLSNVIEIGGQLEKQRVSMGAILGDTAKANVLFDQIKGLAVKSPFGVVELDQYTKQLAAYGFQYNELYEMIKRLADISAGAGQDISRLTLALGHVRSQTYLTGYTMRQFSMNNIPMLKMLSDYYGELEGHMVTTAEVQERISNRQVSYEDVIEQIRRLTNEGGMFYNMQEKIADTVATKWKNLQDAFSIMYGELAEGRLGDILKDIAEGLTDVAIHGEEVLAIISALATAFGLYKAAVWSLNAAKTASIMIDEAVLLHNTITAMAGLTKATKAQVVWQGILNKLTLSNPYVALISAVAGLGVAYVLLANKTRTLEEAEADYNEQLEKENQTLVEAENAANRYMKVVANSSKTTEERNNAYNELSKLYPGYFDSLKKEEIMLLNVEDAMKRVSEASKQRSLDLAQARYDEAVQNRINAEENLKKAIPDNGVGILSGWYGGLVNKATGMTESQRQAELDIAKKEEEVALQHLETIKATNSTISELQEQRWFKDSSRYAGTFKELLPKEGEARNDYFKRIGQEVNTLRGQIEELDKSSSAAKEILPDLQNRLSAAENIYLKALGGAKSKTGSEKQAEKDAEKARKEAERILQDQLKEAVNEMDRYIKSESSKFNLYKSLLGKTNNEDFARQAFSGGQMWDEYTNNLREKLEESMNMAVTNWKMDDSLAEKVFGEDTPALKLYQEIVKQIGENYTNALNDAADAMSKQQTTEEKIANLQRQINEWENDTSGLVDHTAQIANAKNEIEELKQSLFSTLPVYEQIFGDTAYRSISSIKEGIRQMNEIIANAKERKDSKTGKANGITSSYIDSNGVKQEVSLTLAEFRRLKEQGDNLFEAWRDKNPFSGLVESLKNLRDTLRDEDADPEEKAKKWAQFASSIAACADVVGDFAGKLSDMFDSLGNEGMASAMEDVQEGMNTVSNIGKGFAEGGVFGGVIAAAGEIANWIGRIADKHDKKLDKAIQKSQREVKKLQNSYKNLEWQVKKQLTAITKSQTQQLLSSLQTQQRELEKQRDLEAKKKKKDADKLIDYDQQIAEMKQQIADFYEEMANDMYGIDLDGWAGQIADAITDAFASGEDAVMAFNDTVADIMNSVVKNIIKISVVKPAMEQLQDFLFGKNGVATLNSEGGVNITPDEAKGLVQQLDALKGKIDSGRTIYDAVAEAMRTMGIDPTGESTSSKSGLSKGIQGTTEETSNILASYLNAVRADVSVIRRIMEVGSISDESPVTQAQLLQLQLIAQNTARTASNTEAINFIYDILQRNVNGVTPFAIK